MYYVIFDYKLVLNLHYKQLNSLEFKLLKYSDPDLAGTKLKN